MEQQVERAYQPIEAGVSGARAEFITRTYNHLAGAIIGFCAIEVVLFKTGVAAQIAEVVFGTSWLMILGAFMLVSWLATHVAHTAESKGAQYFALAGFVAAEALIFVPLLYMADMVAPGAIKSAVLVTGAATAGLTFVAFTTRKDFSFLGAMLRWMGMLALVMIVAAVIFGINLGTFFSVAMVGFAGAAVLYDTSNIIHHYPEDKYVGAALQLFASIALMLWYVLRIFIAARD